MPKISIFSHLLWNGKNGGCFWCCFLPIWRIMMDHGWMGFFIPRMCRVEFDHEDRQTHDTNCFCNEFLPTI